MNTTKQSISNSMKKFINEVETTRKTKKAELSLNKKSLSKSRKSIPRTEKAIKDIKKETNIHSRKSQKGINPNANMNTNMNTNIHVKIKTYDPNNIIKEDNNGYLLYNVEKNTPNSVIYEIFINKIVKYFEQRYRNKTKKAVLKNIVNKSKFFNKSIVLEKHDIDALKEEFILILQKHNYISSTKDVKDNQKYYKKITINLEYINSKFKNGNSFLYDDAIKNDFPTLILLYGDYEGCDIIVNGKSANINNNKGQIFMFIDGLMRERQRHLPIKKGEIYKVYFQLRQKI